MKKKKLFVGILMASAVFGLAACNGGDANTTTSGTPTTTVTTTTSGTTTSATEKVTVTFETNGGSTVNSVQVDKGTKLTKPTNPTKTADESKYEFVGWFTDEGLTTEFNFNTELTSNIKLYAKWNKTDKISVVFANTDLETVKQFPGTITRPTNPTKATDEEYSYTFDNWYSDEDCTTVFDFNTVVNDSITLYAKWNKTQTGFNITYDLSGKSGSVKDTINVKSIPENLPRATTNNYTFEGWYTDKALTTPVVAGTAITEDITLYAKWQAAGIIKSTIWNNVEIGEHAGTGSTKYSADGKSITITGAGTKFDKDSGKDDYFYSFAEVKGDTTVIAKITPDAGNTSGFLGIIARNDTESESMAAGVYYDYSKSQIRYGRHGGAAAAVSSVSDPVYVKIEFSKGAQYTTVASDKDFTNILFARNGMGVTGLEPKTVGFFATAGTSVTFSDISIISKYTDDNNVNKEKVVFSSEYGEMALSHLTSATTSGKYASGNVFNKEIAGNTIYINHKRDASTKGNVREDVGLDYLLLPSTSEDMTITADLYISAIDSGTDKQGFGMGQFSIVEGQATALNILHYQKNKVFQQTYTTNRGSGNSGNPKAESVELKQTFTVTYSKVASKAYFKVVDASGNVLVDNTETPLDLTGSGVNTDITSGKSVQYGFVFSGITCEVSNITLTNSKGQIVYDSNDYYVAQGVAPTISNATAIVSDDRTEIDLAWSIDEPGSGAIKYILYVSQDGAEYTKAAESKTNSFVYTGLSTSGKYKFKIVPVGGDEKGEAIETEEVDYLKPLDKTTITPDNTDSQVTLAWTAVDTATEYDIYRSLGNSNTYEKIATVTDLTYTDSNVTNEESYNYRIVANSDSNSSNPSEYVTVVVSNGHTGEYVYEKDAAVITIVDKSDDTLFTNTGSLTLASDKAGTVILKINGEQKSTQVVTADTNFELALNLVDGRNDVEVLLTDENGKTTRTIFNFVVNPKINAKVDSAFTGTDGTETAGVKMYKTIEAAVNAVPSTNTSSYVIYVLNGTYNERVTVESPYVSLLGQDARKTKIAFSAAIADHTATDMWTRNAMYVAETATGFTAENITIENTYNYTNGNDQQADALCIVADQTLCVNVRLIGYQDTLLTDSKKKEDGKYIKTRQYFEKCYITGNVDFIYGAGSSYFHDCDIVARYTSYKEDGCFTAARTYDHVDYGFVFDSCRFIAETGVKDLAYRLARPWGKDASTTFINCYMGRAVSTTSSYGDMSGNSYKNARFAERGTYGPGYVVNTDRPYLSSTEATAALEKVVAGFDYSTVMTNLYK